eukprot:2197053-Rhodomonas_salina.1
MTTLNPPPAPGTTPQTPRTTRAVPTDKTGKTNDVSKTAIYKQAHDFIKAHTKYNANDVEKRTTQLQEIDTTIAQIAPFIHPPPEPITSQQERLRHWAAIREKHIPRDTAAQRITVAFSLPKTARRPPVPRNMELAGHPFMQSMVYTLKPLST